MNIALTIMNMALTIVLCSFSLNKAFTTLCLRLNHTLIICQGSLINQLNPGYDVPQSHDSTAKHKNTRKYII